jgi:alkanesulfonate monooxygenase SsuD/methylene tetrahydromethanopterin reductase-like flavin-dependent oxidoreductase (luciferase family)
MASSTSFPIEFGWALPPGYNAQKDYVSPNQHANWEGSARWMAPGPQGQGGRERWDASVRRALNTITGHWSSAWMTDHFQWDDNDCLEALTTLAFYAALTPQLKWGTMVLGQGYRNPALTAKMASTIQYLTNGNLILGIGAGWKEDEHKAYGYGFHPPAVRIEQFEDTVAILKAMWSQPHSTYHGKHCHIEDAINLPQTPRAPVLMIGGGGEKKMLPIVARNADWWNVTAYAEDYKRKVDILKRECDAIGRDWNTLRLTWFGGGSVGRTEEEVQRRVRDDFIRDKGIWGTPDQVAALIQSLIDVGCTYFMFDSRGIPEPGELELLIEVTRKFQS